jgi:hypothetical protein
VVYLEGIDQAGTVLGWDDLLQQLFDALYESEPQLKVNYASARTYLSNTSPLVLIDNMMLNADALDRMADLFPQAPILAVSAQPLYAEAFEPFDVKPLQMEESVQLLASRARIDLEEAASDYLQKICTLLNNFPLAIVTVGNVIREHELSLEYVLSALESIQTIATQANKIALERSFQFANKYLSNDERQMMSLTAAAPAISADRPWLELLAGGPQASERLEAMSLLQANSPRLRLHPEFAALVLGTIDVDAIRSQLLTSLTETLQTRSLDFGYVEEELGNILGLLSWAAERQRWGDVISLGRAADPYLTLRGLWDAWQDILDSVLAAGRALGDRSVEAWALHQLGTRSIGTGELQEAANYLSRALGLRQSLGDREGMAHTQHNLDYLGQSGVFMPPPQSGGPAGSALDQAPARRRINWCRILLVLLFLLLLAASSIAVAGAVTSGWIQLPPGLDISAIQRVVPIALTTETPTPTASVSPSPTPTSTSTPTPTSTSTAAPTETATATPTLTRTATQTLTPTEILTATATPVGVTMACVSVDQANCRYGPGACYLYADGLFRDNCREVVGRNFASTWLLLRSEETGRSCWAAGSTLEVTGDLSTIPLRQASLPITVQSSQPTGIQASRNGSIVTISWDQIHTNLEDSRGYLLEVSVCQNGLMTPLCSQTDSTSIQFTDETSCSVASSGQIYSVDSRGYTAPVLIPWP